MSLHPGRNHRRDSRHRPVAPRKDFLREKVAEDVASGRFGRPIHTRFPPEPNGFLHIGHAKSICLNFGIAREFGGRCNLRFDDTNPTTEDVRYVEAIQDDVRWLGFSWDEERFASDYFERLYEIAESLVKAGKAYVDSQSEEAIREGRGTVTLPGTPSPYRDRTGRREPRPAASDARRRVPRRRPRASRPDRHGAPQHADARSAAAPDPARGPLPSRHGVVRLPAVRLRPRAVATRSRGSRTRSARSSSRTTASIYDWLVREAGFERPPEQTEFARLELDYTVLSKRKLLRLVHEGHVTGWDDPRMPTIAGLRRRGVTPGGDLARSPTRSASPEADARIELATFEHAVRDDLNMRVPRVMAVARPLKVVLTNYPDGPGRELDASYYPHDVPQDRIAHGAVLARAVDRARRLHGGPAEEVLPPGAGTRGSAALRLSHHLYRTWSRTQSGAITEIHAARTTPPPAVATPRMAARCRARFTGSPRGTRSTASSGCTIGCSPLPIPTRCPEARTSLPRSIPSRWSSLPGRQDRAERGG